ncbi:MAG: DUF222 domain-containing protein [Acidimicrobiia bacterium]
MVALTEAEPVVGDVAGHPMEWLEAEICTLAGHIAAATCRFLLLIGEFDDRGGWRTWECLSAAHWLSWKCGMSTRTAREHVRVAHALQELPVMTEAFAAGQLSYSKVRAMTRVATPKTERDLVEVAKHGTATHVDRIVAGYCTVKRNVDPDRGRAQLRRRGVWFDTAADGTVTITVRGGADAAAIMRQAVDAAAAVLPALVDEPDAPMAAKRFDGLEHLARTYLEPDEHKAPNTELVVHADLVTLAEREPGRSEIENGPGLSTTTLERLACECGVRLALDQGGTTLDIGRRSRAIPAALRRAIVDRDQGNCRFPGCTLAGRLQVHHGQHWARRGHTKKPNLFLVCLYHHKVLHEGGWNATGDADGTLTFLDPNGRPMPEVSLPPPRTDPGAIRRQHASAGTYITAETITSKQDAVERLDLGHAVQALWYLDPPIFN